MNYRTAANVPDRGIVLELRSSRAMQKLLCVAILGVGAYALVLFYGTTLRCTRDNGTAQCTLTDPALLTRVTFPARAGDLSTDEDNKLFAPRYHTGPRSAAAVRETIAAYERFVANENEQTFDRHLFGHWMMLLALLLPVAAVPSLYRLGSLGQRVRIDAEGDEMTLEELTRTGPEKRATHRLSTIEETSVESVWDTGWYEVIGRRSNDATPLFRGTRDECDRVRELVIPAIAEARRRAG